jgi:hypothetical protein
VGFPVSKGAGHPHGAHQPRVVPGLQPGWQGPGIRERGDDPVGHAGREDLRLGERGADDQAVGRAGGQGAGHPPGARRPGGLRGVQPGRQDAGLGES